MSSPPKPETASAPQFGTAPGTKELSPAESERLRRQTEVLSDILKVKPEDLDTHFKLSEVLMAQHRYGEAVKPLKQILHLQPEHPSAVYNLAQCYLEMGRDEAAIDLLIHAHERHPDSQAVLRLLALAHTNLCVTFGKLKRWNESVDHFKQATGLIPNFGPAHIAMGKTLVHQGQYDKAIKMFKETIKLDPLMLVEAHHNLAQAYAKKGHERKAIKHYKEALKINPKAALVHQHLGEFYFKLNRFGEAVASFENALAMSPKLNPDAWFKLGVARLRLNLIREAEEPLRRAYELTPDNLQVQDALAEVLFRLHRSLKKENKPTESLDRVREAVRLNPLHAKAQFSLAALYDLNGEGRKAIRHMLFAKYCFLEQKNREGLAQSMKLLETWYPKYHLKPEDFDKLLMPERS